mmetsp:Transcript_14758/g.32916  ORF Transcript_14758/g.32916 Transcript_14758/m.32916 type:complete len:101 (+) Transcript_14758:184-486(+)
MTARTDQRLHRLGRSALRLDVDHRRVGCQTDDEGRPLGDHLRDRAVLDVLPLYGADGGRHWDGLGDVDVLFRAYHRGRGSIDDAHHDYFGFSPPCPWTRF